MQASEIHFVSGKGGVGKTAAASAMALAATRARKRVLLCELDGKGQTNALLGVPPTGYDLREVFEDLFMIDINARDAMHEYVLLVLKFETLYRAIFENRLVRAFVDLVPSLGELVTLGKIWFHAVEKVRERRRFDVIVVDAPATGHMLALLHAPQAVFETVPPGPMRDNAALLRDMLQNQTQTQVHVVTTPEDSPVTEAITLVQGTRAAHVHVGALLINRRSPPLPQAALEAFTGARTEPGRAAHAALGARQARLQAGEKELLRLRDMAPGEPFSLPNIVGTNFDVQALHKLAPVFAPMFAA